MDMNAAARLPLRHDPGKQPVRASKRTESVFDLIVIDVLGPRLPRSAAQYLACNPRLCLLLKLALGKHPCLQ